MVADGDEAVEGPRLQAGAHGVGAAKGRQVQGLHADPHGLRILLSQNRNPENLCCKVTEYTVFRRSAYTRLESRW